MTHCNDLLLRPVPSHDLFDDSNNVSSPVHPIMNRANKSGVEVDRRSMVDII